MARTRRVVIELTDADGLKPPHLNIHREGFAERDDMAVVQVVERGLAALRKHIALPPDSRPLVDTIRLDMAALTEPMRGRP